VVRNDASSVDAEWFEESLLIVVSRRRKSRMVTSLSLDSGRIERYQMIKGKEECGESAHHSTFIISCLFVCLFCERKGIDRMMGIDGMNH
jgi:hypothetical protein